MPPGRAGLYELALRSGPYGTRVPIAAGAPVAQPVLVVLPALSWQGLNRVDDDGDGIPDTLANGGPVVLRRPLVAGLPAGFADEAALLAYLDATHRAYDLTTDLGLIDAVGPRLSGHRAVVLAGSERWVPASLAAELRSYATAGGRVVSLGISSLLRSVTLRAGRALDPGGPARVDALGATPGAVVRGSRAPLAVLGDELGIFQGPLPGLGAFEPLSVGGGESPLAAAGTVDGRAAVLAYRLGRGTVIDIGVVGFGPSLAHDAAARDLWNRIWSRL
jgi:hypothetical protein